MGGLNTLHSWIKRPKEGDALWDKSRRAFFIFSQLSGMNGTKQEIISIEVSIMEKTGANEVPTQALIDIRDVQIDTALPQEERIRSFVKQIKNPYRFKVGDVVVNVSYSGEATLNDRFAEMMSLLV